MSIKTMTTSKWQTAGQQLIDRLRREGYVTSGDAAGILGLQRQQLGNLLGEPARRVAKGAQVTRLWRREHVEALKK